MITNRRVPFSVYAALLPFFLIISFYISALFTFSDLSFSNYGEKLNIVLMQFYNVPRWWNSMTPACLALGFLAWVLVVAYLMYKFRNYHPGKEYGTSDWADPAEITKTMSDPDNDLNNRILSRNVRVTTQRLNGEAVLPNNNMLVIGASGTYKTTSVVIPNVLRCSANYIILDVKGELQYQLGLYLKSQGYTIRSLNMKNPEMSDHYNPFEYINSEDDVAQLIENIYASATDLSGTQSPQAKDPFWDEGAKLYMQSLFFYEWWMSKYENRPGNLNNIMQYINEEMRQDKTQPRRPDGSYPTELEVRMNHLAAIPDSGGESNPAVRDYRKMKGGAGETIRSILLIVNAKLKLFEMQSISRLFSGDDLHLEEFAYGVGGTDAEHTTDKKLVLFLCSDNQDTKYNFIFSIVYTQAIKILLNICDNEFHGGLPIPLEFWMDEFYTGARPMGFDVLMGIVRSYNISLIPILQSKAQIESLYEGSRWQVLMDNIPTVLFLGPGRNSKETEEWISELLGKMTIDMATDGKNGQSTSENYQKVGVSLMTPDEVARMDFKYSIIFLSRQHPCYDRKALPWEMDEKVVPWKAAQKINEESPDGGYIHTPGPGYRIKPSVISVDEIPEGSNVIDINEEDFLYMKGIATPEPTEEDVKTTMMNSQQVRVQMKLEFLKLEKKGRDVSGTLEEAIQRCRDSLSSEELAEIIRALLDNLKEDDIKHMLNMNYQTMCKYREFCLCE